VDGELLELEHCEGVSLGEDKGMKELGWGGVVSVVESEVKQDRVCERRDKSTKKKATSGKKHAFRLDWE